MELILVRHGETAWNREGRVQGLSDIDLSDVGVYHARRLAISLKDRPIRAIYASPLIRALKTAEIINRYHDVPLLLEPGLMEMDQGDFEGLTYAELMACERDFLRSWIADPASVRMPNGESLDELQARAWPVIDGILQRSADALVVSHSLTIASILCKIKRISLSDFRSVHVDPASKTLVRFAGGPGEIVSLNDRTHLNDGEESFPSA